MFGEHESESPRVPSPWDPFLPSPPSESIPEANRHIHNGVPRLVPEVEEGNVEYKLKLTQVSCARFARLVTQLKWRLLEGGGQAYYELGVADSGALIGLSRTDLEQSLETLEMMAGEIGASVIVVKEIEVPQSVCSLTDEASKYIDPETGEWTKKMTRKMSPLSEGDSATSTTEADTDFSTTDLTDSDDALSSTTNPTPSASSSRNSLNQWLNKSFSHRLTSHPDRPTAQSSPFIAALDDDLALFSMEPEPPHFVAEGAVDNSDGAASPFAVDLEIASVYKPRPIRRRPHNPPTNATLLQGRYSKHQKYREKEKKPHLWHAKPSAHDDTVEGDFPQEAKAAQRRVARDKRREEKRRALLALSGLADESVSSPNSESDVTALSLAPCRPESAMHNSLRVTHDTVVDVVEKLESELATLQVADEGFIMAGCLSSSVLSSRARAAQPLLEKGRKDWEPRLIVEALVVRKLSIEEAFLDFGGFQLV